MMDQKKNKNQEISDLKKEIANLESKLTELKVTKIKRTRHN